MQTTTADRIKNYTDKGWWENISLQDVFAAIVEDVGDRLALIGPSNRSKFVYGEPSRLTYNNIAAAADKIGSWLYSQGLRQGDKIVMQMPLAIKPASNFIRHRSNIIICKA